LPKQKNSQSNTNASATAGGLSRRQFIYINSALLVAATTPSCSRPGQPRDERNEFRVIRAADMLSLRFELTNLRIEHRYRRAARLVRIDPNRESFLAVGFPGQGIAEETFDVTAADPTGLPVESRVTRPTRLVFRLPDDRNSIDITAASLLDWENLELPIADPDNSSFIEIPCGLSLVPAAGARWTHARHPVVYNDRAELWHTRLAPAGASTLTVRNAGCDTDADFETPLTAANRQALAGLDVTAHTLILSPLGGWLDVRGSWQQETGPARWEHRVTAGQDQHVLFEQAEGHLFPFGHRASRLTVTERALDSETGAAFLRMSKFIVIKEPSRTYTHGQMAFRSLTIDVSSTPALSIPSDSRGREPDAFWVETADDAPYRFPMTATDWNDATLQLDAAAVFMEGDATTGDARSVFDERGDDASYRASDLRGQAAVVVQYLPVTGALSPEPPNGRERTEGDTTLNLLSIRFTGKDLESPIDDLPFACVTEDFAARVPSLQQFLDDDRNQGTFELVDPDDNPGEIFARVPGTDMARIPMYFDRQADLSGGLAAPSFDVDGLSRIHGPVGDADSVMAGNAFNPATSLKAENAKVLGFFDLVGMLFRDTSEEAPAIPQIYFKHKKIEAKADKKDAAEEKKDEAEEKKDEAAEKKPVQRELTMGMKWNVPLEEYGDEKSWVAFEPERDEDEKTLARLLIDVSATRVFGKAKANEDENNSEDEKKPGKDESDTEKPSGSGAALRANGKLSDFSLVMNVSKNSQLRFAFKHIEVKLGPPKKAEEKKDDKSPQSDEPDPDDEKKKESKVSVEVDFVLATIDATGSLNFLKTIIEAAAKVPPLPQIPQQEPSSDYPARMPSPGPADLNVPIGPFTVPKFKWLNFEVSNIVVGGGIGLNFLPKPVEGSDEPEVPDHVFSFRLASADKPMLLLAEPWGGIAHLGMNFTPRRMTGFQLSLGVLYRAEFNLGITKATCEGSLAGAFTYWIEKSEPRDQFDIILKLSGQARLWFMDIHLLLVAVGSYQSTACLWSFSATFTVRVRIGFFSVTASFSFLYEIAGDGCTRRLGSASDGEVPLDGNRITENEWRDYRAAFAGVS
jgi:hypothetical protein